MSYITIRDLGEDNFVEKRSEFIGYAKRCENEEEAKAFIWGIKNKHKQATHNCWAYVVGENKNIQRYSDDGEPQGTAGIPILEVMKKNNITDCAIVVTRYYGGIQLGAGGLTRAYTRGASIAITSAGVVKKVKGLMVRLEVEYDLLGKIQYFMNQNNWYIEEVEYSDKVKISTNMEIIDIENFESSILDICNAKVTITKSDEGNYFKEENRLLTIM